jgi:hypothetical protein
MTKFVGGPRRIFTGQISFSSVYPVSICTKVSISLCRNRRKRHSCSYLSAELCRRMAEESYSMHQLHAPAAVSLEKTNPILMNKGLYWASEPLSMLRRRKKKNKYIQQTNKTNSGTLVRQRTIPTERPPLVGEVSANFSGQRVSRGQRNESPQPLISFF